MVKLEDAVTARYEKQGLTFEVLVDPEAVQMLRDGKDVNLIEYLVIDTIFKDARKGDRASDENIKKVFTTVDTIEVAKKIILNGEVQLTTEQRRKMVEAKRKQIVNIIVMNAINPQTMTPHPPERIESAMDEAKVRIDPFKAADVQIKDILDALRPIIPIRFEKVKIAIRVPGDIYARIYGDIKSMATLLKEEWQPNGAWIGLVEVPAGLQTEFLEKLNNKAHGNLESKIVK